MITVNRLCSIDLCYASINVKPEGGGDPRAYLGHLTSTAFPTLGNLTKNLGPRVGKFAFFARRNGTKSHPPMCSLALIRRLFLIHVSTYFYIYTKTLLLTTHLQYKLMEKVGIFDLI